jgi:hypothetical protein
VGELVLRRTGGGELDELVVQERHARLQPPRHRHVVHALHRVVDQHHGRVDPQRGVERGVGAGLREVGVDERAAGVVVEQPPLLQQARHRGVRAVGEHPQVGVDGPGRGTAASGGYQL